MKACAYCGGDARPLWTVGDRMFDIDGEFTIGRCERCGTVVLLDDVPDISRHYPEAAYHAYEEASAPPVFSAGRRLLPALWNVDGWLIGSAKGPGASVLDVGCGAGAALDAYRKAGFATFGIEPDAKAAERARSRGHTVTTRALVDAGHDDAAFSIVRFRHSLEHIEDPVAAIATAARSLRSGGRCLVEIPNPDGILPRIAGGAWWQLDAPRHAALPPLRVLEKAFASHGLRLELRQTYTFGQGIAATAIFAAQQRGLAWGRGWRLRSPWRPAGYRALTLVCYALAAAIDLAGRGDSLRLVFRKPQ